MQRPLLQIQTKVGHNTFHNEDAEFPCYFSRTNQDAYFHPAYQDERDQCWRQRRNKPNSLQWEKWDGETPQSAEENLVFCSFCQKINFLSVKYTWYNFSAQEECFRATVNDKAVQRDWESTICTYLPNQTVQLLYLQVLSLDIWKEEMEKWDHVLKIWVEINKLCFQSGNAFDIIVRQEKLALYWAGMVWSQWPNGGVWVECCH